MLRKSRWIYYCLRIFIDDRSVAQIIWYTFFSSKWRAVKFMPSESSHSWAAEWLTNRQAVPNETRSYTRLRGQKIFKSSTGKTKVDVSVESCSISETQFYPPRLSPIRTWRETKGDRTVSEVEQPPTDTSNFKLSWSYFVRIAMKGIISRNQDHPHLVLHFCVGTSPYRIIWRSVVQLSHLKGRIRSELDVTKCAQAIPRTSSPFGIPMLKNNTQSFMPFRRLKSWN